MKILTRYILAELIKWFLVSLTALTLIILIFGVGREAIHRGLPPAQVAMLAPYFLPEALRFSVPGTLLLASTSVFGRLSAANEILAVKSMGISPVAVLLPMWVLTFVLSVVTVYINDAGVSWSHKGMRNVVINAAEDIAYGMLRKDKRYKSHNFSINVRRVDGKKLIRPHVWIAGDGKPSTTITAEEAELRSDLEKGMLVIVLKNCIIEIEEYKLELPTSEREIPLYEVSSAGPVSTSPSRMRVSEITEEIGREKAEIERLKNKMALQATKEMLIGDFDSLASRTWDAREKQLEIANSRLHQLQTVPWRRWSDGFSCLCFAFVGSSMAIRLRNHDFLTSFFLCFLPILVVYYPLMALGVYGAKQGFLPPCSVWTGNLLLFAWGGCLLRKVIRY